ncbi:MAG: hypothetical protein GY940_21635 [bacterium]|nr:hypothetical protein [bacterium]
MNETKSKLTSREDTLKKKYRFSVQYSGSMPDEIYQKYGDPRRIEVLPDGYLVHFKKANRESMSLLSFNREFREEVLIYESELLNGFCYDEENGHIYIVLSNYFTLWKSDRSGFKDQRNRILRLDAKGGNEQTLFGGEEGPFFPTCMCLLPGNRLAYHDLSTGQLVVADRDGEKKVHVTSNVERRLLQNLRTTGTGDVLLFESLPDKNSFRWATGEKSKTVYSASMEGDIQPVYRTGSGSNLYSFSVGESHFYCATSDYFKKVDLSGETVFQISTQNVQWHVEGSGEIPVLFNLSGKTTGGLYGLCRFINNKSYGVYRIDI